jgi:two-component system NarL family sensor kinase
VLNEGLTAALRRSAERFQHRTGVIVMVVGEDPIPRLSKTTEIALFRVAQECLTNLAKHAQAGTAVIMLETVGQRARLTVMDDGIGFDARTIPHLGHDHGWGILIMRERLTAVGGHLYVVSAVGSGTRIVAEVAR